jgi:acetyl-CoA carboxylase biotin carboxylase subunit
MFSKILVANRGEIAVRVLRAARRLGAATVAVYSDADAETRHVELADERVRIGPPPPRESYLCVDAILDAARRTGAQAIHPGYGFLAENAGFARRCEETGLVFIGPSPDAIRMMGDKIEARRIMAAAGVPTVPGSMSPCSADDAASAEALAADVGYPLLVKAAGGGGGIGMVRVAAPGKLAQGLAEARRRAEKAFGDPRLYIEKAIDRPRHIEVQLLGDRDGRLIHCFERDCSVQRRHQKVLEETPSPAVDAGRRQAVTRAALAAGRAVRYRSAGTVEFLLDREGRFYFLEMNTRIQVEHPVTEMVTGLDLVEQQIRIAAGERLAVDQADLVQRGHAVECRIYAEDPVTFFPSPGTLSRYDEPAGEHLRVDSWVRRGDTVTPFYDPLLAKIIAWGADRPEAIGRLREALGSYHIEGIKTNIPVHERILADPAFVAGTYDVTLLDRR